MGKDFVTVATFNTERDAEIVRSFLSSYNISAHLLDTDMTSATINIAGASAYTDVRLCVQPQDADRARELIKEYRQRGVKENAPKVIPPPADGIMLCPACNSDAVEKRLPLMMLAMVSVIMPLGIGITYALMYVAATIGLDSRIVAVFAIPLVFSPLFFIKRTWYCLNCYHMWKVSNEA